jgi:hypothetical protein
MPFQEQVARGTGLKRVWEFAGTVQMNATRPDLKIKQEQGESGKESNCELAWNRQPFKDSIHSCGLLSAIYFLFPFSVGFLITR